MTSRRIISAMLVSCSGVVGAASVMTGELDLHFGSGGMVITDTAPGAGGDYQNGLEIQRDGKILVGGESDLGPTAGGLQWRITRYTRKGALDVTFGSGGTALTNMSSVGGFDERLISLAVQHDGKIVAAGWVLTAPDIQNSALVRYNADGTLDRTFGKGGKVITNVASEPDHDFINQVLIDARGRIVVSGGCRRIFVGRYLHNGSLDPSFNSDGPRPGLFLTEVAPSGETNSELLGMVIDERGRIVAGGYSTFLEDGASKVSSALVRFLPDGALDPTFNRHGARPGTVITRMAPGDNWNVVFRVAIDRHGRIVTAGDAFVGVGAGLYDLALARYLPNGTLDPSFGTGGIVLTNAGPGDSDDDAQGLAIEPNGRILVGGSAAPTAFTFDSDFMVARFRPNGTLDTTFGRGGIAVTPTAPGQADDEIFAMKLQDPDSSPAVSATSPRPVATCASPDTTLTAREKTRRGITLGVRRPVPDSRQRERQSERWPAAFCHVVQRFIDTSLISSRG